MVTTAGSPWLALVAGLLVAGAPAVAHADDYADLVAAERAFAADAAARSVREAFLTALTEDAVVFAPGPVNGHQLWQARPADGARLEWAPEAAEVSASGDLGYTFGPWRFTPPGGDKPVRFGHYFTVWQKQPDGQWKAIADKGVVHQEAPVPTAVTRRGHVAFSAGPVAADPHPAIVELRRADLLLPGELSPDIAAADLVAFRNNMQPRLASQARPFALAPPRRADSTAVIAAAGDLAVTWGGGSRGGSWLRVWRRAESGDPTGQTWRLAADVSDDVQVEEEPIAPRKPAPTKPVAPPAPKIEVPQPAAAPVEAPKPATPSVEAPKVAAPPPEAPKVAIPKPAPPAETPKTPAPVPAAPPPPASRPAAKPGEAPAAAPAKPADPPAATPAPVVSVPPSASAPAPAPAPAPVPAAASPASPDPAPAPAPAASVPAPTPATVAPQPAPATSAKPQDPADDASDAGADKDE